MLKKIVSQPKYINRMRRIIRQDISAMGMPVQLTGNRILITGDIVNLYIVRRRHYITMQINIKDQYQSMFPKRSLLYIGFRICDADGREVERLITDEKGMAISISIQLDDPHLFLMGSM